MKIKTHTEVPATEWGTEIHTPSQSFTDSREQRKINSQTPHASPQMTNTYSLNHFTGWNTVYHGRWQMGSELVSDNEVDSACSLNILKLSSSITNLGPEVAVINAFSLTFWSIHHKSLPAVYGLPIHHRSRKFMGNLPLWSASLLQCTCS